VCYREGSHGEIIGLEKSTGFDLIQPQGHGRLVTAQHNAKYQSLDTFERGASAKDIQFLDRFPAQERAEQTSQPEDVIKMPMRDQYAREVLESRAGLKDLSLRAFAAINQKTIFIVFDDLCRKPASCGGRGCRGAKKKYFEQ
jgi:hypothetical protein